MVTEPQTIEGFALSAQQEHLWMLQAGQDAAYHAQCLYLLEGVLDLGLLRRSLELVLSRNEILRTSFRWLEGMDLPLQIIARDVRVQSEHVDLSGLADDAQQAQTQALYERLRDLPLWNADHLPLQTHLITLGSRRHLLVVRLPALCADAGALRNLMREISGCYAACAGEAPPPHESLQYENLQYVDYTQWQQEVTTAEGAHTGLKYWQQDWSGVGTSEMPFTRLKRGEPSSFQPASIDIDLDFEAVRSFQVQAQHDVSVMDVLFSCWLVLLWRLVGGEGLTVAAACDGRKFPELQSAIGLYERYLPIRLPLVGAQKMADVVREAQAGLLDAYRFQDYFTWKTLGASQAGSRQTPSVAFAFEYQVEGSPESIVGDLGISLLRTCVISDRFEVRLSCIARGDVLTGEIHYDRGCVSESDARRLGEGFRALLASAATHPQAAIGALDILSAEERDQLVVEWNKTETDYPRDGCVHKLFEAAAHTHSDAVAVVFEEQQLTYAQLNRRANQLAHTLRGLGVGPDALVGLCLDRSVDLIVGLMGILKAGGAYVPLDPALPQERLRWMLQDSGAQVLVTEGALVGVGEASEVCVCMDRDAHQISQHSEHNPAQQVQAHHLVYVIYTSGSTGRPKGVGVEHRHLLNYVRGVSERLGLKAGASYASVSTLAADLGNTMVFASLCLGGCLHLISSERAMDGAAFGEYLSSHRIDYLKIVPSHLGALLGEGTHASQRLPREVLVLGGEASSWELVAKVRAACPLLRVFNHYGPTETTVGVLTYAVEAGVGAESTGSLTVPLGRALPNSRVYVLNAYLQPVPVGVVGELYIGGAGVSRGYLGRAELTQEKFVSDPFSGEAGARLYRTGDLVRYLSDGNVEFVGRVDNQVKMRGFRIELGEIESVLLSHGEVREAVVLAREDAPGDKRLVAYIVGQTGSVSVSALREHLGEQLPEYMVPSGWVVLEQLPLTANGKVDRKVLPAPESQSQEEGYVAARTPIEEGLAQIWREVLHIEQVGVHASFFALGGHSLLATQVISRIRNTFAVELPLRALFEAPTVARLAGRIEAVSGSEGPTAPLLMRVSREGRLPLSFAQQRLWFIDQLEPESSVYNIPMALRLSGALNVAALELSLEAIVGRHEALRTSFALVEGEPFQVIHEAVAVALPVVDLSSLADNERERTACRRITEEARHPFDLARGPLFRFGLLRLQDDEHILLLTLHHIVSDAWSQRVLRRELSALYNAFSSGAASPLSPLPVQYADYAVWQREWLQGEPLDRQLSYWKERLSSVSPLLELPTDRPRPSVQTFRGARVRREFSAELTASLKALGQHEGTTLFMTLLTAFQILLSRYSGHDDIVVGTPIANRTRAEVEGVIGFFVNTLALRTDLSGDPSFVELLGRVREVCLGGYAHQDLPFEKLVEELQPPRSLSYSPVFQVMFSLANAPGAELGLEGLEIERMGVEGVSAKFDLSLVLSESSGRLGGLFEYNTDLFDADRIARMLGHLESLLVGMVSDPQQKVSHLPLLTQPEREQLLVAWNDTVVEYAGERCVQELFEEQVVRTPDAIALVHEDQQLTYDELNTRANQLAHYLQSLGVGPEVLVGVCMNRSLDMVVALLGILKAGGAYVALDPTYPPQRIQYTLNDADATLLITQEALLDTLPQTRAQTLCLDREPLHTWPTHNPISSATPDSLAYVLYTSGSTGRPKGVAIEHHSPVALVNWALGQLTAEELSGVVCATSICFDLSVYELFVTLCGGGRVLLVENALAIAQLPAHAAPTLINTVPSAMTELLRMGAVPSSVRRVNLAGEPLSASLVEAIYEQTRVSAVYDLYGPSEDTTYSTCALRERGGRVSIGRPISNTRAYVLDGWGRPVPVGVTGELYLGGSGLARGYVKQPEWTACQFVADGFSAVGGARLYRTGDLVRYLPDGRLAFVGRLDHQVKVRGFRIELGEIESVLAQHPGIREAVVVAREDEPGTKRLVAYLVEEVATEVGALRDYLEDKLPGYMVPSAFVTLESLPLSPNGKVDRKALPAPDSARPDLTLGYTAPSTAVEEALSRIWCDVLRLEQVGIHDNFFELGGDSILTIRIIARANAAGLRLTPRQVFQHQTIAGLAAVAGTQAALQSEQGVVTGPVVLTPIQRWFFEQDRVEAHHFNQSRLLTLRQRVSPEALKHVASALVSHHDALRLRFIRTRQGWEQTNAAAETNAFFSVVDLSDTALEERSAAITATCTELQGSLNLSEGPLLRVCYFDVGAEEPARVFIVIHHLGVDGVSWRILLEDLASGIEQLTRGEAISLPAKTTSFQQWALRLEEYAGSSALSSELDYWQEVSGSQASPLPVDNPSGVNTACSERVVRVSLEVEETRALLSEVPSVYHTQINDALLTALARSVGKWTGERGVLVDLEGHGREALFEEVDLSRTVGWFTSLYPVLLELPSTSDCGECLKRVKETLRRAPNRGLGYGVLRYLSSDAGIREGLMGACEPQISFNYHGQFGTDQSDAGLLGAAPEFVGPVHSPQALRTHLLNIIGHVSQGRLKLAFFYSEAVHASLTVEGLAESYLQALRELIAHCQSPDVGGFTPSDFPKARVSQEALDRLLAGIRKQ